MSSNATGKKNAGMKLHKFVDEDCDFVPRKKEKFKKEPHKTMRYAQI